METMTAAVTPRWRVVVTMGVVPFVVRRINAAGRFLTMRRGAIRRQERPRLRDRDSAPYLWPCHRSGSTVRFETIRRPDLLQLAGRGSVARVGWEIGRNRRSGDGHLAPDGLRGIASASPVPSSFIGASLR